MTNLGWGLIVVGAIAFFVFRAGAGKIIGDEARARADDLPMWILNVAVRFLPPDARDDYRTDWEGNLLAALHDSTVRYPATRLLKSCKFAFQLMMGVGRLRRELEHQTGLERIVVNGVALAVRHRRRIAASGVSIAAGMGLSLGITVLLGPGGVRYVSYGLAGVLGLITALFNLRIWLGKKALEG